MDFKEISGLFENANRKLPAGYQFNIIVEPWNDDEIKMSLGIFKGAACIYKYLIHYSVSTMGDDGNLDWDAAIEKICANNLLDKWQARIEDSYQGKTFEDKILNMAQNVNLA